MGGDRKRKAGDLAFGLISLGIALVIWWTASQLPPSPFDPLGPGSFPQVVSGALGLFSLILIGRLVLGLNVGQSTVAMIQGVSDNSSNQPRPKLALGLCAATFVYAAVLVISPVPFFWVTFTYLSFLGFLLTGRSKRELARAVLIGGLVAAAISYLFTGVLRVALP